MQKGEKIRMLQRESWTDIQVFICQNRCMNLRYDTLTAMSNR